MLFRQNETQRITKKPKEAIRASMKDGCQCVSCPSAGQPFLELLLDWGGSGGDYEIKRPLFFFLLGGSEDLARRY